MPFKVKDLMVTLQGQAAGKDGEDLAWAFVIGCGISVECPSTQPTQMADIFRHDAIDFEADPVDPFDLLYMQKALKDKLTELGAVEAALRASFTDVQLEDFEKRVKQLDEERGIDELTLRDKSESGVRRASELPRKRCPK